jgi:predicted transport protein
MSDIKLFSFSGKQVRELTSQSVGLEKSLQSLIESNLDTLLGVTFLATEYPTGKKHSGRIDTLGIDENGCPVIIEYKRSLNENVINQGLFYFDWLLDHQKEFQWLVMDKVGKDVASKVEWSGPRLICIAGDSTRYDEHAVQQINRNIELVRYRKYGDEFLLLELVNSVQVSEPAPSSVSSSKKKQQYKTVSEYLDGSPDSIKDLFATVKSFLLSLGDDVQVKTLKFYFAFRRIKNFVCVEVHPQSSELLLFLKIDPDSLDLSTFGKDFARDVRSIGHLGTGDLEVRLRSSADLEKAKTLILRSYEES